MVRPDGALVDEKLHRNFGVSQTFRYMAQHFYFVLA